MKSKYKGTCKACGFKFPEGADVKWLGKGNGVMHMCCANAEGMNTVVVEKRTDNDGQEFTVEFHPPKPTGKTVTCDEGCGGTGLYVKGINNGKVVSDGSPCFRCNGKGVQTDADRTRNYWYDVKFRKVYM